jgi:hypothetical protein
MNAIECNNEKSNKWIDARDMNICISGLSVFVIISLPNVCDCIQYDKDRSMGEKQQEMLTVESDLQSV